MKSPPQYADQEYHERLRQKMVFSYLCINTPDTPLNNAHFVRFLFIKNYQARLFSYK